MENRNYYTKRAYKGGKPTEIVEEDLTREEARQRVQDNIDENPDAEESMLVFDKVEDDYDYDYDDRDEDNDSGMSHSQQCAHDRAEVANERLERGEIDEEQASEIRMGA